MTDNLLLSLFAEQGMRKIAVELAQLLWGALRLNFTPRIQPRQGTARTVSTGNCQHPGCKKGTAQTSVRVGTSEPPRRAYPRRMI